MKAKFMSSFAAGLIVATSVCGAVYFFGPTEVTSKQTIEKPSEEEMKTMLSSAGYLIHTDDELQEMLAAVAAVEPVEPVEPVKDSAKEVEETIVYRTILNVASGMTSIDVGRALAQGKIIDNPMDFFNAVEERGLANELRPGTFELDSDMTIEEVIAIIFKL